MMVWREERPAACNLDASMLQRFGLEVDNFVSLLLQREVIEQAGIDADVLEWVKSKGAGYQTRINSVLRAFTEVAR